MSKVHDQRCIDSNRFGEGFDCNCKPDWRTLAIEMERQWALRELSEWHSAGKDPNAIEIICRGVHPSVAVLVRKHSQNPLGTCHRCKKRAPLREEQVRSVACDHEGCYGDCGRTIPVQVCAWSSCRA